MANKPTTSGRPSSPVADPKPVKQRSPNYPLIDLEKAVEKAKVLHDSYRTAPVSTATAALKLGYKADSGIAGQTLATLRAFGLLHAEGSGQDRKVRITEDGAKIIGNHVARAQLLRTAALTPRIHREIWDKFFAGKAAPDPDDLIAHYLRWDRDEGKFNPESIQPLLNQFKRTIAFAKLDSSATIPVRGETDPEESEQMNATVEKPVAAKPMPDLGGPCEESRWKLPSGHAVLRYPTKMTARDFTVLKKQIELLEFAATDDDNDQAE